MAVPPWFGVDAHVVVGTTYRDRTGVGTEIHRSGAGEFD